MTLIKEEILTSHEVADLFKVDTKTVARWDNEGKLAADFRTIGGHRRYFASRIHALMLAPEGERTDQGTL